VDATEKRLTLAYTRAVEIVNHLPENSPQFPRALAKMQKARDALRRYQARTSRQQK